MHLKADDQLIAFAKNNNYQQCNQCKFWVERSDGCNELKCRCGNVFCYSCGGEMGGPGGCSSYTCRKDKEQ